MGRRLLRILLRYCWWSLLQSQSSTSPSPEKVIEPLVVPPVETGTNSTVEDATKLKRISDHDSSSERLVRLGEGLNPSRTGVVPQSFWGPFFRSVFHHKQSVSWAELTFSRTGLSQQLSLHRALAVWEWWVSTNLELQALCAYSLDLVLSWSKSMHATEVFWPHWLWSA